MATRHVGLLPCSKGLLLQRIWANTLTLPPHQEHCIEVVLKVSEISIHLICHALVAKGDDLHALLILASNFDSFLQSPMTVTGELSGLKIDRGREKGRIKEE